MSLFKVGLAPPKRLLQKEMAHPLEPKRQWPKPLPVLSHCLFSLKEGHVARQNCPYFRPNFAHVKGKKEPRRSLSRVWTINSNSTFLFLITVIIYFAK